MSLSLDAQGQLPARLARIKKSLKRYMTLAAADAGAWTREVLQRQAAAFMQAGRSGGRGQDPIRSIRLTIYPKTGDSIGAAAEIRFAANWWRAHVEGPEVITAGSGRWLAIPLPAAIDMKLDRSMSRGGTAGARLMKRSSIPQGLRFVPLDGGRRGLLVLDTGSRYVKKRGAAERFKSADRRQGPGVPLFLLVRSVRLPKRINVKKAEQDGYRRYIRAVERGLASAVEG